MLVLSRKVGEKIHIGPDITITLVKIGPNTARLGVDAPDDVAIHRDELRAATEQAERPESQLRDAQR
jgi:carbon storage regulator